MIFILVFATAFLVALVMTPLAARLAPRLGTMDQPGGRRVHTVPTPRLGGLPLFTAFFAALAVSLLYPRTDQYELLRLAGLFAGTLLLFLVGAYDDRREIKPLPQLIAQVVAASLAVFSGVLIRQVQNPLGEMITLDLWFAIPFTLFWLVGMTNTVNWLDGIDGLAGGVVAIAGLLLFVHAVRQEQYSIALIALALCGAVVGFLIFNLPPARIFMGSSGALVLGYVLGVLSIIGAARVAFLLLVLGIPIVDVAWQILTRVRAGKSPFYATRTHLHHRLLDAGLSQRSILWLYYIFTGISGLLALVLPLGFYKLIAILVITAGAVLLLVRVSQTANTGPRTGAPSAPPLEEHPAVLPKPPPEVETKPASHR